jgi:hypothetical protein
MLITENNNNKWSQIIKEELGVEDKNKLGWMSKYAQNHEIFESVQSVQNADAGIYATPFNTMGIGNPMMPQGVGYTQGAGIGNTGADFHNPQYKVGSGDIPMSTLTMSLEVAAMTIGLELVPVIPANGPWAMLSYMDFPYAGGKLGRTNETALDGKGKGDENKPIYIKVPYAIVYAAGKSKKDIPAGTTITFENAISQKLVSKFIGFSRIDNSIIVKVVECQNKEGQMASDISIADVFSSKVSIWNIFDAAGNKVTDIPGDGSGAQLVNADLVAAAADHVQGFTNFFDGSDEPMTRAQNETGVGNTIGARMFTKMVQMGSYEVVGAVTRQQLQDMPLYGVDVVGKVLEQMQNQISQAINNRILDRLFKLGVTNAKVQKEYQNVDLNLYFGSTLNAKKALKDFAGASKFVDIHGNNVAANWGEVMNATQNTSAENFTTHQRRVMTRLLGAANLIANVSRFGRGQWAVCSTHMLSILQDCASFVVAPMVNDLVQDGSRSLYFAGSIAGLNIYVDPYMTWDDMRICVGRKSDGNTPGVIFMPYILADTVQIVAEGTMAPKMLVNSRFAIVDAGFHPEQSYITFMVDADGAYLL